MAVTRDANGTSATEATISPSDTTKLTVGSGLNRALVVQITTQASNTVTAVAWDQTGTPQPLTVIKSQQNATSLRSADLWGLVNPTAGNKTLRVTWTGGGRVIINATSYIGVIQTGGTTTFPNSVAATGNSGTGSTGSITSTSGDITVGVLAAAMSSATPTQTQLFFLSGVGSVDGAASEATTGTATHSWTITSTQWAAVGTDIKAIATGGNEVFQPLSQPTNHYWSDIVTV